jgi:hypothetical protein
MNWNDLEVIWRRQELPAGADADLDDLKRTFDSKRRKLAATLMVRDISEASAGLLGAAAFSFFGWKMGRTGWPIAVAVLLVLGVTGFFVRERFRAHRNRLGPDASLRDKLAAEIAELQHQRSLLAKVGTWYLAPIAGAIVIVAGTITFNAPAYALAANWIFLSFYAVFCTLLFWWVWALNRRTVRKRLEPRLAELEKLQRDFSSSDKI